MTLLLGPNNFTVSQTYATIISQGEFNNTIGNKTISHDPISTVAAMVTAVGEPFYELTDAVDTGKEVVSLDPQQTKDSYVAQGYMVGIGNVTEHGIYVSTYSSPSISSTGKGMIVQGDNVATFTATDTGEYDNEGNLFLKGRCISIRIVTIWKVLMEKWDCISTGKVTMVLIGQRHGYGSRVEFVF
jgi:hypothetical protein